MSKRIAIAVTFIVMLSAVALCGVSSASKSPVVKKTPTKLPVKVVPQQFADPVLRIQMVAIPAGSFLMGNSGVGADALWAEHCPQEMKQHSVTLAAYSIGKYEVTRGQYISFMNAGGYTNSTYWSTDGWNWKLTNHRTEPAYWAASQNVGTPPGAFTQTDNHPVVGVTYYEAEAFCSWARGHLPTEAQWERAARWTGSSSRVYPWGDTFDGEKCNGRFDSLYPGSQTAPVGSYPSGASPSGCQDMAGNVAEWCKDWYQDTYSSPSIDPQGPATGIARVMRGGSWVSGNDSNQCRCAYRIGQGPLSSELCFGFRLAR